MDRDRPGGGRRGSGQLAGAGGQPAALTGRAVAAPRESTPIAEAKLPATYEAAKLALAECSRVDECATWANKAEALASYAKQADDDELRLMADRIQARAVRRAGELLREVAPGAAGRPKLGQAPAPISRSQVAREAGLSRHQKQDALRVAAIPAADFEAAVESKRPPTVSDLARRGTMPPRPDVLRGRAPADYHAATRFGMFPAFVESAPRSTRPLFSAASLGINGTAYWRTPMRPATGTARFRALLQSERHRGRSVSRTLTRLLLHHNIACDAPLAASSSPARTVTDQCVPCTHPRTVHSA
jgi:hypothetical protein